MARFYASIQGNRGEATRMGTTSSGIAGHIRGWHAGAAVKCAAEGDADRVDVLATEGSERERQIPLATIRRAGADISIELAETERMKDAARRLLGIA